MAIEDLSTGAGTTPLGLSENTERLYNPPNQPQDQVKMWQMRFIIDDLQRVIKALADLGVQVNTDLLTNKGDLLTHDSTSDTILPIGTNEYILSVDTSTSTSLAYISKAAVVDGGLTVADTDTVDLTKTVAQITAAVRMQMSITSDVNGVKLSGDEATPGNTEYYGTDGAAAKGFHSLMDAVGANVGARLKYTDPTIYVNLNPITETADFTLDENYDGRLTILDNAVELAVTVPAEPHDIEGGAEMLFFANTDGALYFLEDTGVHIHARDHKLGLDGHGAVGTLIYLGSDEWSLTGDLTTALDASALAYLNAIEPFATLTEAQMGYVNDWFVYAKANSIYSLYESVHFVFWAAAGANKFNAINPVDSDAAFRQTYTGSPTHGSTGITLNGTTQWIHSKLVPNTHLTADDTHLSIYSQTSATTSGYDAGVADGLNQWLLIKRDGSGNFISDMYAFARRSSTANADGKGDYMGSRTSATVHKKYKNGVQSGSTETGTASGFSNLVNEIMFGAIKLNGAPTGPVAATYSAMTIGAGMDDTQAAHHHTAMNNLMTAFGINV